MINFEDVSFSYENNLILKSISINIGDHDFIGILGPNGGGKSTFLKLALGLLKPSCGKIERTNKTISYISQTTSISDSSFPATVYEVISLGLVNNHLTFHFKNDKKKVIEILKKMNLYELRNHLVNELSGGQLQRVKVAKALISNPTFLVLDEPDSGMDERAHEELVKTIIQLHNEGMGILFVSHHPEDLKNADKIYYISNGNIDLYKIGDKYVNL